MTNRFLTSFLGVLLFFSSIQLRAQGFSIVLDTLTVQPGQDFCIPVKCKGFVNLTTFQFSMHWNPQVLKFKQSKNLCLPGWSASDFSTDYSNGYLFVSWTHPAGVCFSKMDGDTLFEACFTAIGTPGNSTLITVGSGGFPPGNGGAEAYDCFGENIWTIPPGSDTGLVIINPVSGTWSLIQDKGVTFELVPNPTHTSTELWIKQSTSGIHVISVTDAFGRFVYQQKNQLQEADSSIEIPKEALSTPGFYIVSLKTENGVFTQLLSVN